jgi:hypothetical protein
MQKVSSVLILSLFAITVSAFTNPDLANELKKKSIATSPVDDKKAALKKWEATPEGMKFKKWEASIVGKKVYAAEAKIRKSIREYTNMEGVVTSLSLPPGSRLGFGVMVKLNGEDYILSFGPELKNEFEQLHKLKVNDKIMIKSRVSHAPKYAYPIIAGDNIEKDGKLIFKRPSGKEGC